MRPTITAGLVLFLASAPGGQLRSQALREGLKDAEVGDHWIYDDFDAGRERARKSGKPLLALFR